MVHPSKTQGQLAWLEIEGGSEAPLCVRCPREDSTKTVQECVACKRYTTLAIHPSGKRIYVTCEPFVELPGETE